MTRIPPQVVRPNEANDLYRTGMAPDFHGRNRGNANRGARANNGVHPEPAVNPEHVAQANGSNERGQCKYNGRQRRAC